jgi:hypothetical protein
MTIATGVGKKVAYKKEVTFGVDPAAGGAQYLRRVTSTIDLAKDTYQSAELRTDYQVADMRHGMRKVGGNLKDELSCGTFKDWLAAIARAAWVAGTAITTGALTTISSQVGPPGTITRSAGSFITDGFRVGDIITMSGWATTMTGANATAYQIMAVTATVMTLDGLTPAAFALVTKAAGDSVTVLRSTSKVMVPLSGHTDDSFTIEHQYTDIVQSERFNGCKMNSLDIQLPATGIATMDWNVMGQNAQSVASTGYFTTPTAPTTTGVMAAVNGQLIYNGVVNALVTSASIKIEGGMSVGAVVGSNQTPSVFPGRVRVSGQLGIYFQDAATGRDDFWNEATPSLSIAMASDGGILPASIFVITMPKIKLGGFTRADGEQGIIATAPFTALLPAATTGLDTTTISFQDSTF